ncbi:NUDIX hydrolase [Roseibium sp.]|uniref:NUDIX hydrolase n=1 Tax=Roseibium sp. TaxID=1936156 RepID=UPI003B52F01E
MSFAPTSLYERSSWLQSFQAMFRRPARLQIAALCVRENDGGREVLMVTSKSSRRWILPKGWPIMSRKPHRTAAIEAYEEAGVVGKARKKPFASFKSYKGADAGLRLKTDVLVYRVDVDEMVRNYPEKGKRTVTWVPVEKAIKMADEPGLAKVLRRLIK